jgi:hypothetical protein
MRDTIDMAREAGLLPILDEYAFQNWEWEKTKKVLKCFEALVRADEREAFRKIQFESILQAIKIEREACAVITETPISGEQDDITMQAKDRVAAAIRARGNT